MRKLLVSSIAILALGAGPVLAAHGGGHGGHHGGSAAASSGSAAAGVGATGSASAAASGGSRGTMSAANVNGMHGGSLQPGAGFADTQIPWGSTDTSVQGGPSLGGMGGSTMQVSDYGKKSWPCYPAGQWAGSADFHAPAGCK